MKNFLFNFIAIYFLYGVANYIYHMGQSAAYANSLKIIREEKSVSVMVDKISRAKSNLIGE